MTKLARIIATNWIHMPGFYVTTYLSLVLFKAIGLDTTDSWEAVLLTSIVSILILFAVYGLTIIGGVFLALIILDIAAFSWDNKWKKEALLVQWAIISFPFIYWAFHYEYWLWLTLSVSLLTTQLIRLRWIREIGVER